MSGTYSGTEARLGNGRTVVLAEPGRRILARLVDMFVLSPAVLVFVGSFLGEGLAGVAHGLASLGGSQHGYEVPNELYLARWAALSVLVLYEPLMMARWGATVGKLVVGIRVVRYANGWRVSHGESWARAALPTAAGVLTLGAGWFIVWSVLVWPTVSGRDYRGWHDRLSSTIVVTRASALSVRSSVVPK